MFLKSELLESNGSSVTLFQLSALQRIEHLEYLKQMEAVEGGDIQAAVTLTVKSGAYLVAMSLWHGHSLKGSQGDNAAAEVAKIQDEAGHGLYLYAASFVLPFGAIMRGGEG